MGQIQLNQVSKTSSSCFSLSEPHLGHVFGSSRATIVSRRGSVEQTIEPPRPSSKARIVCWNQAGWCENTRPNMPQLAVKKDQKPIIAFWQKTIYVPLPDYGSVQELWKRVVQRYGAELNQDFNMSALTLVTKGHPPGDFVRAVRMMLTKRRMETLQKRPIDLHEVLKHLAKLEAVPKEVEDGVRDWTYNLPWRQAKPGLPPPKPAKGKKKK